MEKPAETPCKIALAPGMELEAIMVIAWKRGGRRRSSSLLLGLRKRRARVSSVEDGEKEKESSDLRREGERFSGCGTEKKGKWEI